MMTDRITEALAKTGITLSDLAYKLAHQPGMWPLVESTEVTPEQVVTMYNSLARLRDELTIDDTYVHLNRRWLRTVAKALDVSPAWLAHIEDELFEYPQKEESAKPKPADERRVCNITVDRNEDGWEVGYLKSTVYVRSVGRGPSILSAVEAAIGKCEWSGVPVMNVLHARIGNPLSPIAWRVMGEIFRPPSRTCPACRGDGTVRAHNRDTTLALRPWKLCSCLRRLEP